MSNNGRGYGDENYLKRVRISRNKQKIISWAEKMLMILGVTGEGK